MREAGSRSAWPIGPEHRVQPRGHNDLIQFYDLTKTPAEKKTGPPHTYRDRVFRVPPEADRLSGRWRGGDNHEVTQWDLRDTRRPAAVLCGKGTGLWDVALSTDDRYLGIRDQRDPDSIDPNQRVRNRGACSTWSLASGFSTPPRNSSLLPGERPWRAGK